MKTNILCLVSAMFTALLGAAEFNFEKSADGKLPPGFVQIKDKWCAGTAEVTDAPFEGRKKALKLTVNAPKTSVRVLVPEKESITVKNGDVLVYEFIVKGRGSVGGGYYGVNVPAFNAGYKNIDSEAFRKIKIELKR